MINKILKCINNLKIEDGFKFRDKSFKYDTIFFGVRMLSKYIAKNNVISLSDNGRLEIIAGFKEYLQLKNKKKSRNANANYFNELINFLIATNIIEKIDDQNIKILNLEIFNYIGSCMETAYIFQYLAAYVAFKNSNLWGTYKTFCLSSFVKKEKIYTKQIIPTIKKILPKKKWFLFISKFFMMILGLINNQPETTRTGKLKLNRLITPDDLANRKGTRTETFKTNEYAEKFNLNTVKFMLKNYLAIPYHQAFYDIKQLEKYSEKDLPKDILKIRQKIQQANEIKTNDEEAIREIIRLNEERLRSMPDEKRQQLLTTINKINLNAQKAKVARKRDQLLAELAKININYLDEFDGEKSFVGKDGKNYVEAHHILEFKRELGPDISLNLICLNPMHHSLLHHGSKEEIKNFFTICRDKKIITIKRFEKMCTQYQCLTERHVKILLDKSIITETDSIHLLNLIKIFGCKNAPIARS